MKKDKFLAITLTIIGIIFSVEMCRCIYNLAINNYASSTDAMRSMACCVIAAVAVAIVDVASFGSK